MSVICKNTGHRQEIECINCDCGSYEDHGRWRPYPDEKPDAQSSECCELLCFGDTGNEKIQKATGG
jgi:hypothetical protein